MDKHLRLFFILAILIPSGSIAKHAITAPSGLKKITGKCQPLSTPELIVTPHGTYQTTIHLEVYYNPEEQVNSVELYRSLNSSTGYQLIATLPAGGGMEYSDEDLKPRTTFHYRVRTVNDSEVSDYAYFSHTTESKWYQPEFTAAANSTGTAVVFTITDRSYQEDSYQIERSDGFFNGGGEIADSGRTVTYTDYNVFPDRTYTYTIQALLKDEGSPLAEIATVTIHTPLGVPEVGFPDEEYPDQTDIAFSVYNPNQGGMTEVWRSFSEASGYQLIATLPYNEDNFADRNLKPRTFYYYILRAAKDGAYSEFSKPQPFRTQSKNYPPVFTARAIDENTIELTLTDKSYNDIGYTIRGTTPGNNFYEEVYFETDSGSTIIRIHEPVNPGTYYSYSADMQSMGEGLPVLRNIASTSVTTPGAASCSGSLIQQEVWTDIPGTDVSAIPLYERPDYTRTLTIFETASNIGTNYGARVRGYICVPQTGSYTFWIASDDKSELYLSTDDTPGKKVKIASVTGHTSPRQWNRYSSQQSAPISLEAGHMYYIEALHKEASGQDNLAVGWQLPDGTMERPIAGNRLNLYQPDYNKPPVVAITSPENNQQFSAPATIDFAVTASDPDGSVVRVAFYHQGNKIGEDLTAPYTFRWSNVPAGNYQIQVIASDDAIHAGYGTVNFTVNPASCIASGTINREVWTGITGTDISSIPVNSEPNAVNTLTIFETANFSGNDYGARVRGYLCVPVTGNYTFWIASDDSGELWLSTDDNPANKVRIAFVSGYTYVRQWTKYATQQSAPVNLVAGYRYYVEALHKEANGADHLAVGWQLPNGNFERPIPGIRLSEFEDPATQFAATRKNGTEEINAVSLERADGITLFPNPTANHEVTLSLSSNDHAGWNDASVQVISMTGEVLHQERVICTENCNDVLLKLKESVTPGVYLVNVMKDRKRLTKKLMVK
jgi:hypothetical protein